MFNCALYNTNWTERNKNVLRATKVKRQTLRGTNIPNLWQKSMSTSTSVAQATSRSPSQPPVAEGAGRKCWWMAHWWKSCLQCKCQGLCCGRHGPASASARGDGAACRSTAAELGVERVPALSQAHQQSIHTWTRLRGAETTAKTATNTAVCSCRNNRTQAGPPHVTTRGRERAAKACLELQSGDGRRP